MISANGEGVTRDVMKWWRESVRFQSDPRFGLLDVAARGLFYSLKFPAVEHGDLPNDPTSLAYMARLPVEAVVESLPRLLESGLFVKSDDGKSISCPVLEEQVSVTVQAVVDRKIKGREAAMRRWSERTPQLP